MPERGVPEILLEQRVSNELGGLQVGDEIAGDGGVNRQEVTSRCGRRWWWGGRRSWASNARLCCELRGPEAFRYVSRGLEEAVALVEGRALQQQQKAREGP